FRVGRIADELESPEQALPYLRQAQQIQERLLTASPADPRRLQALGDTENAIGRALHRGQKLDEALQAYRKASELRQRLVDLFPREGEFRRALANSIMNIGLVEKDLGEPDIAAGKLQSAQQVREALLAEGNELPRVDRDLAMGAYNL